MNKIPAVDFLRYLHPVRNALVALTLVPVDGSSKRVVQCLFPRCECPRFLNLAYAKNQQEEYNVFCSVASFRNGGEGATIRNVAAVHALVLDIDRVSSKNRSVIEGGGSTPPSIIVSTSPGHCHLYWLLKEPLADTDLYTVYAQQLVERFDGDPHAVDAARKLRVPGFVNWKRNCPCELVRLDPSLRYSPGDLSLSTLRASRSPVPCNAGFPPAAKGAASRYSKYVDAALSRSWEKRLLRDNDYSAADYAAMGTLCGIGLTPAEAADLVREYSTARRIETGRRLHDDAYWTHTAESASRVATRNNASPLWRVPEPVNADVEEPFDVVEDFTPSL